MRLYYGWVIVAICMVVLMLVIGTTVSAFGLFVLPVSKAFDLSRADMNTGIILLTLGMAIAAPFLGRLLDLFSVRKIMIVGAILFSASMIALGLSRNMWLSAFVLAVPLALGVSSVGILTAPTLVARWFAVQRGRAIAITMMGMSLGSVAVIPLVGLLIDAFGWRQCLVVLGVTLAVIFFLLIPFVREKPGPNDVETQASAQRSEGKEAPQVSATPLKTLQLLRIPHFWTITLSAALSLGALQTVTISIVPLAQEHGLSVHQSASLLSLLGATAIVGKLGLAWVGERVDRVLLLSGLFALVAITSLTLLFGKSYVALLACSGFLGLAAGAVMPAFLALLADRFGPATFGTANGTASFLIAVCGAASVRFGGEVYDRTGNYDAMFLTFIAIGLVSAAIMFAICPLRRKRANVGCA